MRDAVLLTWRLCYLLMVVDLGSGGCECRPGGEHAALLMARERDKKDRSIMQGRRQGGLVAFHSFPLLSLLLPRPPEDRPSVFVPS